MTREFSLFSCLWLNVNTLAQLEDFGLTIKAKHFCNFESASHSLVSIKRSSAHILLSLFFLFLSVSLFNFSLSISLPLCSHCLYVFPFLSPLATFSLPLSLNSLFSIFSFYSTFPFFHPCVCLAICLFLSLSVYV